eukprot:1721325-Amphidinium_carterae.1
MSISAVALEADFVRDKRQMANLLITGLGQQDCLIRHSIVTTLWLLYKSVQHDPHQGLFRLS